MCVMYRSYVCMLRVFVTHECDVSCARMLRMHVCTYGMSSMYVLLCVLCVCMLCGLGLLRCVCCVCVVLCMLCMRVCYVYM